MVHQYSTGQTPDAVSVPLHTRRQRCQEGEVIGEGVSPLHRLPYAWSLYPPADDLRVSTRRVQQRPETCDAHAFCPTVFIGHSAGKEGFTVSCHVW